MSSPITMDTDHEGAGGLFQEFRMQVDSDDGAIDEFWVIKLEISDPEMFEFETTILWGDPETGEEFEAFPLDVRIRDEIDALAESAIEEVIGFPEDPWGDAGVTQKDFL